MGDCACLKSTDNSYTIRPLIGNRNWGGVGKSCDAQVKPKGDFTKMKSPCMKQSVSW